MANRDEWLLIHEVAKIARVSPDTVRFWIKKGRLRSVRPGRRRLVRRDVLEAFLSATSKPAKSEGTRAPVELRLAAIRLLVCWPKYSRLISRNAFHRRLLPGPSTITRAIALSANVAI